MLISAGQSKSRDSSGQQIVRYYNSKDPRGQKTIGKRGSKLLMANGVRKWDWRTGSSYLPSWTWTVSAMQVGLHLPASGSCRQHNDWLRWLQLLSWQHGQSRRRSITPQGSSSIGTPSCTMTLHVSADFAAAECDGMHIQMLHQICLKSRPISRHG